MIDGRQRKRVHDAVNDFLTRAGEAFGRRFRPPVINFNWSCERKAAACFNWVTWTIKINHELFTPENEEEFVTLTTPHECAHLCIRTLFPKARDAHGTEWRNLLDHLGFQRVQKFHCMTSPAVSNRMLLMCDCKTPPRPVAKHLIHMYLRRPPHCVKCNKPCRLVT